MIDAFPPLTRRTFLGRTSLGLGAAALSMLLGREARAGDVLRRLPHFAPKVKRVIFLYMSGGPSHLETFDYKPKLAAMDGRPMPESFTHGQPIAPRMWSAGFLPGRYQGVLFRSQGDPVLYLKGPDGVHRDQERDLVDAVQKLDTLHNDAVADAEIDTRIAQYELAFKMQTSV